ncbi:MAG: GNAT family N-acetyltransferase [Janthinobacterium lividum]
MKSTLEILDTTLTSPSDLIDNGISGFNNRTISFSNIKDLAIDYKIITHNRIESTRMTLREPMVRDVDCLFRIYSDTRTNIFNPAGPMRSRADADVIMERWLSSWTEHGFGMWAIGLTGESDRVIGFGGLSYASFGTETKVNLGYRFAPEVWGQGFATELASIAVNHGLQGLNLEEIFAKVRPNHDASRKVLEKAGLTEYGLLDDVSDAPPSIVYRIARRGRMP